MKALSLDPSVALGFFCKNEEDFDSWCHLVHQEILKKRNLRMFELVEKHPPSLAPPSFLQPSQMSKLQELSSLNRPTSCLNQKKSLRFLTFEKLRLRFILPKVTAKASRAAPGLTCSASRCVRPATEVPQKHTDTSKSLLPVCKKTQ
uniref:Uncharacterized protein n=1 Tax=Anguilla anguilla TaxID=7936 RepID=A0A0E9RED1_ANGAN